MLNNLKITRSTVRRVPEQTAESVNQQIRSRIRSNVAKLAGASCEEIERRLQELDEEWDIERALEANASTAMLTTLTLGVVHDRRWFAMSGLVAGFLLMHAVQGWCPPLPLLRRLGFRTASEIDEERFALKALRGDFVGLSKPCAGEEEIAALERFEGEGGYAYEEPPVTHRDRVEEVLEAVKI